MFQKLNFKFDDEVVKKCLFLTQKIDTFPILDHNKIQAYEFFDYEDGSEEKDFCQKFEKQAKENIEKHGLTYDHRIIDFPYKKILDYLPKFLTNIEMPNARWQKFGAKSLVAPHIDADRMCSINFYLSVSDETTMFYHKKRPGIMFKLKSGYTANESFLEEWLEPAGSFVAKQFDVYLLNSIQPHAVWNTTDKDRISLQFSFKKTTYETVWSILQNLNV